MFQIENLGSEIDPDDSAYLVGKNINRGVATLVCITTLSEVRNVYLTDDLTNPTITMKVEKDWSDSQFIANCVDNVRRASVGDIDLHFTIFYCANHGLQAQLTNPPLERDMRVWYCLFDKEFQDGTVSLDYGQIDLSINAMRNLQNQDNPKPVVSVLPDFSDEKFISIGCGVEGVEFPLQISSMTKMVEFHNAELNFNLKGELFGRDSAVSQSLTCSPVVQDRETQISASLYSGEISANDIYANCYNTNPQDYRFEEIHPDLTAFVEENTRLSLYAPTNRTYDFQLTDIFLYKPKNVNDLYTIISNSGMLAFKTFDVTDIKYSTVIVGDEEKEFLMTNGLLDSTIEFMLEPIHRVHQIGFAEFKDGMYICNMDDASFFTMFYLSQPCIEEPFSSVDCGTDFNEHLNFYVNKVDNHTATPECARVSKYAVCMSSNLEPNNLEIKVISPVYNLKDVTQLSFGAYQTEEINRACPRTAHRIITKRDYILGAYESINGHCNWCSRNFAGYSLSNYDPGSVLGDGSERVDKCSQKINKCASEYYSQVQAAIKIPVSLAVKGGTWQCKMYDLESDLTPWNNALSAPLACSGNHLIPSMMKPSKVIYNEQGESFSNFRCEPIPQECIDLGASPTRKLILSSDFGDQERETHLLVGEVDSFSINTYKMLSTYEKVACYSMNDEKVDEVLIKNVLPHGPECNHQTNCSFSNDLSQIVCYFVQTEFCDHPIFFEIVQNFDENNRVDFLQERATDLRDSLVFRVDPVTDSKDINVTLRAFSDYEKTEQIVHDTFWLHDYNVVGECERRVGDGIVIDTTTHDNGFVRITCSDPNFSKPDCKESSAQEITTYFLEVMAYDGTTDYTTFQESHNWHEVFALYKTHHPNNTDTWMANTKLPPDFYQIYNGLWFKQFTYMLFYNELAEHMSLENPILIAKCSKVVDQLGNQKSAYASLDRMSALFHHQRNLDLQNQMTTTERDVVTVNVKVTETPGTESNNDIFIILYSIIGVLGCGIIGAIIAILIYFLRSEDTRRTKQDYNYRMII